jgi:hypothetical protein
MEQHQRRSMSRAFGAIQLNFASVKGALDKAGKYFAHNVFRLVFIGSVLIRLMFTGSRQRYRK